MKTKSIKIKKILWFALEVLTVFILTQLVSYGFGYFGPAAIALILMTSAYLLFILVFAAANNIDRKGIEQILLKY
jgi:hypothetical protein